MEGLPRHPVRGPRRRAEVVLTPAPRRLVLLRHGRTADNASGRIQGQLDTPLDDVGHAQAAAVAPVLAEASPALVVTSDLVRARDTARALSQRLGVDEVPDARLRELDLGRWQGLTSEQARERFPDEHAAWRRGDDVARGGGETYRAAGERAAACVREHAARLAPGETLVVVTHGGTARATLGVLLELPRETWGRLAPLGNTCWSVLVESDLGWRLERHNAGLGPVVGPASGTHQVRTVAPAGRRPSRDVEPVR